MKKTFLALLAVAALAAVSAVAASGADSTGAAAAAAAGKITVSGNGIVQSEPDTVEWSFGVTADADSASAALSRVNAAANRVVSALRASGIAQKDIRTEGVSVSPRTDETGRLIERFVASNSIHAVVRNLAQAGRVVDAAVGAGANTMWGPSFSESGRERLYRQALKAAFENARVSAQVLAEASNVTLGPVVEVQEGGGVQPVPMMAEAQRAGVDDVATSIEPGRSSTYASVTVTYATS